MNASFPGSGVLLRRTDPIAQNVFHWGDRVAVCQGERQLTYRELDAHADSVGSFIASHLDARRQRVALFFSRNRQEFFEITLGAKRVGVSYTNFHAYLSGEQFVEQIRSHPYKVLFLDEESLRKIEPLLPLLFSEGVVVVDVQNRHPRTAHYDTLLVSERPAASMPDVVPQGYGGPVMLTSGTTGPAKLVSVRASSQAGAEANKLFGIGDGDINLVVGKLYHGGAHSWAKGHLNRGGKVVLLESSSLDLNPAEVLNAIRQWRITNFWVSPPWLQGLCLYLAGTAGPLELSSLQAIFVGAAPFAPVLKRQAVSHFGPIVWGNYAITEFGLVSVLKPDELLQKPASVGRPAPGVSVEIRDEHGQVLPPLQLGEIYASTVLTGGEFLPTGDCGKLTSDGYLTVEGRVTERILTAGLSVYPREIEYVLMEMPGVLEAHVLGMPDPDSDLRETVVAVVVPAPLARLTEEDVLRFLSERISERWKLPRRVVFRPSLPRTPYKINNRLLRESL